MSDLTNVNPRYLGSEQKGRLASLLLRWKTADTIFVVLSVRFQVLRYSPSVAMSLLSTPSLCLPISISMHDC